MERVMVRVLGADDWTLIESGYVFMKLSSRSIRSAAGTFEIESQRFSLRLSRDHWGSLLELNSILEARYWQNYYSENADIDFYGQTRGVGYDDARDWAEFTFYDPLDLFNENDKEIRITPPEYFSDEELLELAEISAPVTFEKTPNAWLEYLFAQLYEQHGVAFNIETLIDTYDSGVNDTPILGRYESDMEGDEDFGAFQLNLFNVFNPSSGGFIIERQIYIKFKESSGKYYVSIAQITTREDPLDGSTSTRIIGRRYKIDNLVSLSLIGTIDSLLPAGYIDEYLGGEWIDSIDVGGGTYYGNIIVGANGEYGESNTFPYIFSEGELNRDYAVYIRYTGDIILENISITLENQGSVDWAAYRKTVSARDMLLEILELTVSTIYYDPAAGVIKISNMLLSNGESYDLDNNDFKEYPAGEEISLSCSTSIGTIFLGDNHPVKNILEAYFRNMSDLVIRSRRIYYIGNEHISLQSEILLSGEAKNYLCSEIEILADGTWITVWELAGTSRSSGEIVRRWVRLSVTEDFPLITLIGDERFVMNKTFLAGAAVNAAASVKHNYLTGAEQAKMMLTGKFNLAQQWLYKSGSTPYNDDGELIDYSGEGNDAGLSNNNVIEFDGVSGNAIGTQSGVGSGDFYYEYRGTIDLSGANKYLFSDGYIAYSYAYVAIYFDASADELRLVLDDGSAISTYVLRDTSLGDADGDYVIITITRTGSALSWTYENLTKSYTDSGNDTDSKNTSHAEDLCIASTGNLARYGNIQFDSLKIGTSSTNITHWYTGATNGGTTIYDKVGSNNLTINSLSYVTFTQNDIAFHNNLAYGFTDLSGVFIPYDSAGNPISGSGTNHPPVNGHNGAETKITLESYGAKSYDEMIALAIADNRFELVEDEDGNLSEIKVTKLTETDTEHYTADNNPTQELIESGNLVSPINQTIKLLISGGDNASVAAAQTFLFDPAQMTITAATSGEDGNNIQMVFVVGATRNIAVVEGSTIVITLTYEAGDLISACTTELDSVAEHITYSIDVDGALSDLSGFLEDGYTPKLEISNVSF